MRKVCCIEDMILLTWTWGILLLLDITPATTSYGYTFIIIEFELLALSCDHRTIFIDEIGT